MNETPLKVPIKVILADPHPIVREGLRNFLEVDGFCKVVAEAGDGAAALFAAAQHAHQVLVMNAVLPGSDVFDVIRKFKQHNKDSRVVVCYISEDTSLLQEFRNSGTNGFIGQNATSGEYAAAVKAVIEGGNFFSENLTKVIFTTQRAVGERSNAYGLTTRETEILSLLANGLCNKEIANKYDLSVRTVETHRLNIRRKTSANTLSDLVRVARSLGLSSMGGAVFMDPPVAVVEQK